MPAISPDIKVVLKKNLRTLSLHSHTTDVWQYTDRELNAEDVLVVGRSEIVNLDGVQTKARRVKDVNGKSGEHIFVKNSELTSAVVPDLAELLVNLLFHLEIRRTNSNKVRAGHLDLATRTRTFIALLSD